MRIRNHATNKKWMFFYVVSASAVLIILWIKFNDHVTWSQRMVDGIEADEKIAFMQTKMQFVQMQYQREQREVERLQALLKGSMDGQQRTEQKEKNQYYLEFMKHLKNMSDGFAFVEPEEDPEPLQAQLMVTPMRHLMNHPKSRSPAFQVLSPRKSTDVDVVIGIPTVKRDKESYLVETIESLINGMTQDELARTLIVVSIGEATDFQYVADTALKINLMFKSYFGQLIEVISPSEHWYPDMNTIEPSLGDSKKRTQWRCKQNLDIIFLMSYAQSKGTYYLMLEDDIVAKKGFMTEIMKFTATQTLQNPKWFFINFSTIGGLGKFFRTEDLILFNEYVQVFYKYMPIDWLVEFYLAGRMCGVGKTSKECGDLKSTIRPTYKISLFEHAGMFSSLRGKIQKIKPSLRRGKSLAPFYPHVNPPVRNITSSIQSEQEHTIVRAYNGEDYFWGVKPKTDDVIAFWFNPPVKLERFYIGTSNTLHLKEVIRRGVVELLPEFEDKFTIVEEFDEFGNSAGYVDPKFGRLTALRIRILENMTHGIIINEIELLPVANTSS